MRTIPNFFIVGAPKCGTTAWYEYLKGHPDIFFPEEKEPHFFSTDFPGLRAVTDRAEYFGLFDGHVREKIVGDASASYLYSNEAAANIRQHNPDSKILIFLRDQEAYLPSWHSQLLYSGTEDIRDFERAWAMSGSRHGVNVPRFYRELKLLDYKSVGRFSEQVRRYFDLFPREQIRVIHFREWTCDPRAAYLNILNFLEVDDDGREDFPVFNEAKHHRTRFVVRFVRQPPRLVHKAVTLIKRATGRSGLGLANLAFRLDTRAGMAGNISPSLAQEIREFYASDNAMVEALIAGDIQA